MEGQESRRLAASLVNSVGPEADAEHMADVMVATWQKIDDVLRPVIGRGGVAALYTRALYIAGSTYPWLARTGEPGETPVEFDLLKSILAQQSGAQAAAGGVALLRTFYDLLNSLVGRALTKQLLGPVWANSLSGLPAQDTSL